MRESPERASPPRIAIIGAGWTGIGCLKVLREAGCAVQVFEREDDVGGTWHPDNVYAGLRIHAPAIAVEYPDFPLGGGIDSLERITAGQVHTYFRRFCEAKGFYPHITFGRRVAGVTYDPSTRTSTLKLMDPAGRVERSEPFDYVVYTHGFTERALPVFEGRDTFKGEVLHSFDVSQAVLQDLVAAGKRVVVLGGGKTATDFILNFHHYGFKVAWLYRKPYWFSNYTLTQDVRRRRADGRGGRWLTQAVIALGMLLSVTFPWLHVALMRAFGLVHTYGTPHSDYRKFHFGLLDEQQIQVLRDYAQRHAIPGEVARLEAEGVRLEDGRMIGADVVICCTGSGPGGRPMLDVDIAGGSKVDLSTVRRVYRGRVIPEVPGLILTSFHAFSLGVANGLTTGAWIERYIRLAPDSAYLRERATTFDYPYFGVSKTFDSGEYYAAHAKRIMAPMFAAGEISRWVYFRYAFELLTGGKPVGALAFRPLEEPTTRSGCPRERVAGGLQAP